jgi:hypothetical protein
MGSLFFNQDMKANLSKKTDTNKSNENACWWRTNEKKDPNAMDVNALTMEGRGMLLRHVEDTTDLHDYVRSLPGAGEFPLWCIRCRVHLSLNKLKKSIYQSIR